MFHGMDIKYIEVKMYEILNIYVLIWEIINIQELNDVFVLQIWFLSIYQLI